MSGPLCPRQEPGGRTVAALAWSWLAADSTGACRRRRARPPRRPAKPELGLSAQSLFSLTWRRAGASVTHRKSGSGGATQPSARGPQGSLPKQLQPRLPHTAPACASHTSLGRPPALPVGPLLEAWHHQDPGWTGFSSGWWGLGLRDRSRAADLESDSVTGSRAKSEQPSALEVPPPRGAAWASPPTPHPKMYPH